MRDRFTSQRPTSQPVYEPNLSPPDDVPRYRTLFLCCVLSAVARPAFAQLRQTYDNAVSWFVYQGDGNLGNRFGVIYDFTVRREGPFENMLALFTRGALMYELTPNVRVGAGYSRSETWPAGELPVPYRTPEHRIYQQVLFTHAAGRVGISHRYRIEQRWQGRKDPPSDDVTNWVRTNRGRYQLRFTLPLQGSTLDVGEWYTTAANEVMVSWGSNVQYNLFDQNRTSLGVGFRLNKDVRLETAFLEQISAKSNGRQLERNHTVTFTVNHAWALRR